MGQYWNRIRERVTGIVLNHAKRQVPGSTDGRHMDWLPPVLGPSDWSLGMMADRSAGWYFERR